MKRFAIFFGCFVVIGVGAFIALWQYTLQAETGGASYVVSGVVTTNAVCGDGKLDPSEECDDGNDVPFDGCTRCLVDVGYSCKGQPSVCVRSAKVVTGCGNGIIEGNELCDDGNGRDGDGCSYRCEVEYGWVCSGQPSVCHKRPPCGDGVIEPGEQCDDGNSSDYDGCNAACQIEQGYSCTGLPSRCAKTR